MSVDILTRQALIIGTIVDAITGTPPRRPVTLNAVRDDTDRAVAGALVKVNSDGNFVLSGDPFTVLPPQNVTLRLEARAAGYQPQDPTVDFTIADLTRVSDDLVHDGALVSATVIGGVPKVLNIALLPEPVMLKGRVSRADDSSVPIEGAQVAITAPVPLGPVATNAEGFFTLGPAPVVETVTLSITAAGFDALTRDVRLDFRQPVNIGAFALEES